MSSTWGCLRRVDDWCVLCVKYTSLEEKKTSLDLLKAFDHSLPYFGELFISELLIAIVLQYYHMSRHYTGLPTKDETLKTKLYGIFFFVFLHS